MKEKSPIRGDRELFIPPTVASTCPLDSLPVRSRWHSIASTFFRVNNRTNQSRQNHVTRISFHHATYSAFCGQKSRVPGGFKYDSESILFARLSVSKILMAYLIVPANFFQRSRVSLATAMLVIVVDQQFQEETTSQVLRIMMFSRLISDCRQSDTKWLASSANLFATQPVRPQIRQHLVSNPGNTGLPSEESTYPLLS